MRRMRTTPLGATTFSIRVDSYENGLMQGMVDGALLQQPREFKSMPQLFMMLDELMDDEGAVAPLSKRDSSFLPTLELEILFRQHHSWQGRVRRLDEKRELSFRSALELIIDLDLLLGE